MRYVSAVAMEPNQVELENLRQLLTLARAEDLGGGDVTSAMLPADARAAGRFVARGGLVVCGGAFLAAIGAAYDGAIQTNVLAADGQGVEAGATLAEWSGPAGAVLSAERVALNFLQRLCGIATLTREYVEAVAATSADIYDTRKTTPGWRRLEKYAVRAGGGRNHRIGLYDAVLVKDNHLALLQRAGAPQPPAALPALAALAEKLAEARDALDGRGFVEVEVDTLKQFDAALKLPLDVILLDNFALDDLAEAVRRRDAAGLAGALALEASGGVDLASVGRIAATGVDRIAIGALTHSAPAADVAFDIDQP